MSPDITKDFNFMDGVLRQFNVVGYYFAYDENTSFAAGGNYKGESDVVIVPLSALSGLSLTFAAVSASFMALFF